MIKIIDYGMGNLGSIRNMLKKISAPCEITNDAESLRSASKLILPGVGSFAAGMKRLEASGLVETLNELVLQQRMPVLGICLGMQLMTRHSTEGDSLGLGWVRANTLHLSELAGASKHKIPHMGWNVARHCKTSELTKGCADDEEERFYFVHSYFVEMDDPTEILLKAEYGAEFTAAFAVDNIYGVQFHPEKSQRFGLRMLKNFVEMR
jgi:imidazole glycerol-phosphate synthase subunit HisH